MSQPNRVPSEVRHFKEILGTQINGELPLLVGGHAVNLWAQLYAEAVGSELESLLPLTSKDLDIFGGIEVLQSMKAGFGGEYRLSGPRSPVVGQLIVKLNGVDRQIDVLREVVGLRRQEVDSVTLQFAVDGRLHPIRILPIGLLLRAKICNLATLDQTDRNDLKHVQLMLLVVREFLADSVGSAEAGKVDSRTVINQLEETRKIILSREAVKCQRAHGISYAGIWPRELLARARDQRFLNFARHRLP